MPSARLALLLLALSIMACGAGSKRPIRASTTLFFPPSPAIEGHVAGPLVVRSGLAFVADEDALVVRAFDLAHDRELWSAPVEATPGHLAITSAGTLFVALRDLDRVDRVDVHGEQPIATPLAKTACVEPIGLALTADDSTLLVACGWSHEVVAISVESSRVLWRVDLPLEPRAVITTGPYAVVSHAAGGRASMIDLKTRSVQTLELRGGLVARGAGFGPVLPGATMMTSNGFALAEYDGKVYAPAFASMTDRGPNVSAVYYGSTFDEGIVFPIVPDVAASSKASKWLYARIPAQQTSGIIARGSRASTVDMHGCLAPRGVAVRPTGPKTDPDPKAEAPSTRLVACPGNDRIFEHDQTGVVIRRIAVPGAPSAIAMAGNDTAIVWSKASRKLSSIDLREGSIEHVIAASAEGRESESAVSAREAAMRGRRIFEAVDDKRITSSGRGCASCHPDGRADALTWGTPEGPRQTMMLAGRLQGTAPYGWTRGMKTVHGYVGETIRRLGGSGLVREDMEALTAYITQLRAPDPSRLSAAAIAAYPPSRVSRGRAIFESSEAGCSTCHSGAQFTDGMSHAVAGSSSAGPANAPPANDAFDTPSLRFVGITAPYFHDGRYPSLRALLLDVDGKMGRTKHLSRDDMDALESYLRTL